MSRDQELYKLITREIVDLSPPCAKWITMKANVEGEFNSGNFKYEYEDPYGSIRKIIAGEKVNLEIFTMLFELREFFISQRMPPWKGMTFSVNFEENKFSTEFIYD